MPPNFVFLELVYKVYFHEKNLSSFCFSTAIGIRCKDGVVFGVEKLVLSKLYEEGSNKRLFNVDRHVGMVRLHLKMFFFCLVQFLVV